MTWKVSVPADVGRTFRITAPFLFVRCARGGVPEPATRTVAALIGAPLMSVAVIVIATVWPRTGDVLPATFIPFASTTFWAGDQSPWLPSASTAATRQRRRPPFV